jgi:hypothetical protein
VHGLIFASFRDYLADSYGEDGARAVFEGESPYLLSESYPDERLTSLVERACRLARRSTEALLHDFGVFTGETTFTRLYPSFYDVSPSARAFLLTAETRIHELVRATIPNAQPPQLRVSELGEDGVSVVYRSPRRLCLLLRGLMEGTARHYGERTAIEERTCMHAGDDACTLEVRFSSVQQHA